MIVRTVGDEHETSWDGYVDKHQGASIYHSYAWRKLIGDVFGRDTHYLIGLERSKVVGVMPLARLKSLVFGDFLISLPYFNYGGVLASCHRARVQLVSAACELAKRLGVDHVEFRSSPAQDEGGECWEGLSARNDKVSMRLPLSSDPQELFRVFKPKLRAQIRRPQKAGASHRSGGIELVDEFYRVFSRNMRDLGTPVYSKQLFVWILNQFPEAARLFVVDFEGRPAAAGLVIGHRKMLEIPWASSLREANHASVNMLLYWRILEWACEQGYTTFDFGRSTRDSGTYRFKRQWGAEPKSLEWRYWLAASHDPPQINPDNPKYRLAVNTWCRLPLWLANGFGPHVVKNLP